MLGPAAIFWGVALPLIVVAGGLWLARGAGWVTPITLALALPLGYVGVDRWPGWPPAETHHWLLHVSMLAGLYGVAETVRRPRPAWARWVLRAVLLGVVVWLTARPMLRYHWEGLEKLLWPVGAGLAGLVLWAGLERQSERVKGVTLPLVLTLAIGATAVAWALGGSVKYGQMAGALSMAVLGIAVVAWLRPDVKTGAGGVAVIVPVGLGLLLNGAFYLEDVPVWAAPVLAVALMAGALRHVGPVAKLKPLPATLVTLLATAAIAGAVVVPLALQAAGTTDTEADLYMDF